MDSDTLITTYICTTYMKAYIVLSFFLFKAQASNKQNMLGPTKIYLAVQPSNSEATATDTAQPPPLAPVQQTTSLLTGQVTSQVQTSIQSNVGTGIHQIGNSTVQQVCNISMPLKPKVVTKSIIN